MMKMKPAGAAVLLLLCSALVVVAAESGERVELQCTQTQMEAMQIKLRASERRVQLLMNDQEEIHTKLREMTTKVEEQRAALDQLKESTQRRVAFSASLAETGGETTTGPFSIPTPLVYRHVFTNIGNAYNPNTGFFTAPVKGVYHFEVYVFGNGHKSIPAGVSLHKNGEHVVIAYCYQDTTDVTVSNGVSLLLEVGDVVNLKMWPHAYLRDSYNHHTTFSGHLLFTM